MNSKISSAQTAVGAFAKEVSIDSRPEPTDLTRIAPSESRNKSQPNSSWLDRWTVMLILSGLRFRVPDLASSNMPSRSSVSSDRNGAASLSIASRPPLHAAVHLRRPFPFRLASPPSSPAPIGPPPSLSAPPSRGYFPSAGPESRPPVSMAKGRGPVSGMPKLNNDFMRIRPTSRALHRSKQEKGVV